MHSRIRILDDQLRRFCIVFPRILHRGPGKGFRAFAAKGIAFGTPNVDQKK
jgi:hypothetical protein